MEEWNQNTSKEEPAIDSEGSRDEKHMTSVLLFKTTFFSTFMFVFAALLVRFLLNLQTAFLLYFYKIHFIYSLFDIRFSTTDGSKWPYTRILLVFGLCYLLLSIIGIIFLNQLKRIHKISWKLKLFLVWFTFVLVYSFPAGVIAGTFLFEGFGRAYQWLVGGIIIRIAIGVATLVILLLFRNIWVNLFLKACPNRIFLKSDEYKKWYLDYVFFKSWILGFFLLLLFNLPNFNGFWTVFLLSLGMVAVPFFIQPTMSKNYSIRKSDRMIFNSRYSLPLLVILFILIWVAGNFTFTF